MTESDNLFNTPPIFSIYMAGEVFKYLLKKGGVKAIYDINVKKAEMLYNRMRSRSNEVTAEEKQSHHSIYKTTFIA